MGALESMLSILKATEIYALGGSSLVDYELQAYAVGLYLVYDVLTKLEQESFIATALDYGLLNREDQFRISAPRTAQERRSAILKHGAITPNNFTKIDMEHALTMAGLDTEICESAAAKKLYINCLGQAADETARQFALKTAKLFLPAHLNAELDFRSISWNNTDDSNEVFNTKDGFGYTWDAIDCYGNAMLKL